MAAAGKIARCVWRWGEGRRVSETATQRPNERTQPEKRRGEQRR